MATVIIPSTEFPLFQMNGETETDFRHRVYRRAEVWCHYARDSEIPSDGPVRVVWMMFTEIREMDDDTLGKFYNVLRGLGPDYSTDAWVNLARNELDRRSKTD